jgi:hypothetical protein
MRGRSRERGAVAIATALVVILVATLLGAAVADVARIELVLSQTRRTLGRGLAAAEACLARVTAALPAGWDQASAIAGADGIAGTTDDGVLVAPSGCSASLLPGPLGSVRAYLDVAATVPGGGRRLRAIVAPSPDPMPAVVWTTGSTPLGTVGGRLRIDGVDAARPDLAPLPGFATPDDPALVDAWLAANPGVSTVGATRRAAWAPGPPVQAIASRLLGSGAIPTFTPTTVPSPPALHFVAGDTGISTPGMGAGILYVDGRLDIMADFAFSGIVAARGGVQVASGVRVQIDGGMWLGLPAFDVGGDVTVRHDRAALDAAGALFPLPRPAVIAGLLDR